MSTITEILDSVRQLSTTDRTQVLRELLQVRSERPLHVMLKECQPTGEGLFRHAFVVTNWSDETIVVSSLIDWYKDAEAGTVCHQYLLLAPKSTHDLQLDIRYPDVVIKLRGYVLPSDAREVIVSQYQGR